jgi:hypothetical protein
MIHLNPHCQPIINKINMGCGASAGGQSPVLPTLQQNGQTNSSAPVKETPRKGKNDLDSSIRNSNLQSSGTNKVNSSKSIPKTNLTSSKNPEKPFDKSALTSSKTSIKEDKRVINETSSKIIKKDENHSQHERAKS